MTAQKKIAELDDVAGWVQLLRSASADKARAERLLHASPQEAADLDYLRQHTGFARVITVTPADLDRVSVA